MNVTPRIGMLISWDPSLIVPLTTTLGIEDMYDLVEIMMIDAYNDRVIAKHNKDK